jgi:hypothetical protein
MEFGLQPRDRWQACREHRSGSPLSNMVAGRAPCLNRVQGAAHRVFWAHFDNREGQAGMDLCIYCDLGFGFRFSPPIWGVVDPRGGVAKWLAAKAFRPPANRLREIQKSATQRKLALPVPETPSAFHRHAQRNAFRRPDVRQQRRVLVSGNSTAKPTPKTRGAV